jgi:hypothetical protein
MSVTGLPRWSVHFSCSFIHFTRCVYTSLKDYRWTGVDLPLLNLSLGPKHTYLNPQFREKKGPPEDLLGTTIILPSLSRNGICFSGDGLRTNRTNLSVPEKLGQSWFTFPVVHMFLSLTYTRIHTSTHPMITLLTLASTQVHGFFFATKPLPFRQYILSLGVPIPHGTQCMRGVYISQLLFLVFHHTDTRI